MKRCLDENAFNNWANVFQLNEICRSKIQLNVHCSLFSKEKKSLFCRHLKVKLNWRIVSVNKWEKKKKMLLFFFFFLNTPSGQKEKLVKMILIFWCNRNLNKLLHLSQYSELHFKSKGENWKLENWAIIHSPLLLSLIYVKGWGSNKMSASHCIVNWN